MLQFPVLRWQRSAFLVALLLGGILTAQAQVPSGGGPQPGGGGVATTPIDGGASLLLAGAVAYGIKRLRRGRPTGPH